MKPKQPLRPDNSRKWIIEVTEEQLLLIAACIEDIHRFMTGQCELDNSRSAISYPQAKEIRERLAPLKEFTGEYDWAGSGCPNPSQKKIIAQTYGIYREILHQVIIHRDRLGANVYATPTLTCSLSTPLPIIRPKEEYGND